MNALAQAMCLGALLTAMPAAAADPRARSEPIRPIPAQVPQDAAKVSLGRRLFHDKRLSGDGSIACVSCHDLAHGGADGRRRSLGIGGAEGEINAPSVLNSGFNFRQFWDGRANSLENQVEGPVHNLKEMGSSWSEVRARLGRDPDYVAAFARVYGGITDDSIKDAIATFERTLATPDGPFDRYLGGDGTAITVEEAEGYALFKSYGCVSCHQGIGVGGNMYEVFGVMGDYFADRGDITRADLGRFNVTGDDGDRHVFKVPSLRNVALTAPYFHDGSAARLEDAVAIMGTYQLGRELTAHEVERIVQFLRTLTGVQPEIASP